MDQSRLDNDLSELQEKTQVVNQKRKFDQERSFEKLSSMEEQILELQMKNYQMTVRSNVRISFRKRVMRWKSK